MNVKLLVHHVTGRVYKVKDCDRRKYYWSEIKVVFLNSYRVREMRNNCFYVSSLYRSKFIPSCAQMTEWLAVYLGYVCQENCLLVWTLKVYCRVYKSIRTFAKTLKTGT